MTVTDSKGCEWPNKIQAEMNGELNWCGCGSNIEAIKFLREILRCFKREDWSESNKKLDKLLHVTDNECGLYYSYLYMLDKTGYIEHGGSIGGSWLTQKGKDILEMIDLSDEELELKLDEENT